MTIEIIRDHNELPPRPSPDYLQKTQPWQWEYYVRSALNPHVVIAGHSGDCYRRSDGAEWTHPYYQVEADAGNHVICTPTYTNERPGAKPVAAPTRKARR